MKEKPKCYSSSYTVLFFQLHYRQITYIKFNEKYSLSTVFLEVYCLFYIIHKTKKYLNIFQRNFIHIDDYEFHTQVENSTLSKTTNNIKIYIVTENRNKSLII